MNYFGERGEQYSWNRIEGPSETTMNLGAFGNYHESPGLKNELHISRLVSNSQFCIFVQDTLQGEEFILHSRSQSELQFNLLYHAA